jgi:Domain of unknown function (DUF397)
VRQKSELDDATYQISSFSGGGSCVAVARLASGEYVVRHSRNAEQWVVFTEQEWRAFIAGVKESEFDF